LMRECEHAQRIIAAVVGAVSLPVTLKMRTGWDALNRNAPEIARRAEAEGVVLISVHARTRCQFFKGAPDWAFVRRVKECVRIPVVINGDVVDPASALAALAASGADGVMIGRGACGAPWMPARVAARLATGEDPGAPPLAHQAAIASAHIEAMLVERGELHRPWVSAAPTTCADGVPCCAPPIAPTQSFAAFVSSTRKRRRWPHERRAGPRPRAADPAPAHRV